ncbi:MAG: general secretion pathway protein GspK [Candidatus Omnitrophica bacterium]|nr:general secretion pathway protein GspK [Candidatus Omnitrophota bacterium]
MTTVKCTDYKNCQDPQKLAVRSRLTNDSGIVLVLVLWLVAFLSALAFIMGRSAQADVALARYQSARIRTEGYVWSGLNFALARLKNEFSNDTADTDGNHQARIASSTTILEEAVGTGSFRLSCPVSTEADEAPATTWFQDEAARLNLNGLTANNCAVLKELLLGLGIEASMAKEISLSVVDWQDADNIPASGEQDGEDDFYMSQKRPYHSKNRPLESVEELLLVKGMTPGILDTLRPFITIFPRSGGLRVNLKTAAKPVLLALARAISATQINTNLSDADALVGKIMEYRNVSQDGTSATSTEMDAESLKLNAGEKAIFFTLMTYKSMAPEAVRFAVSAKDSYTGVQASGEFIVDLHTRAILSWQVSSS